MTDEARVPHDPEGPGPVEAGTKPCPDCNVPWPCPERLRQRAIARPMHDELRGGGFKAIGGGEWRDGLGQLVRIGYGREGLRAHYTFGAIDLSSDDADISWLNRALA